MHIFCIALTYVNFIAVTAYLLFALVAFPKKMAKTDPAKNRKNKPEEAYKRSVFDRYMLKITLITLVSLTIAALACLGDGLSDENYILAATLVVIFLGFALALFLHIFFGLVGARCGVACKLGDKATIGTGFFIGYFYASVFGIALYCFLCII